MTPEEFDDCFNRFKYVAVRLETLQDYTPCEPDEVAAFLRGDPRQERSVRTSPWLARIALTTITEGKRWERVRIVDEPLNDFTRYEMLSYTESQACGERIFIARDRDGALTDDIAGDFWLFDPGQPSAYALAMRYEPDGTWLGADLITDPEMLGQYDRKYVMARSWSAPLNVYLAQQARTAVPAPPSVIILDGIARESSA